MSEPTSAEVLTAKMTGKNIESVEEDLDPTLEDEETPETEENDVEESEETTEETSEEELPDNIKAILAKNRAETKAAKAELARLKKEREAAEASETTETPADNRYKELFINTAARTALKEAGLSTGTDRFLKMIDLSEVEVDDEGNVVGLEEQVAALTEEFKDLIAPAKPVRKVARTDAANRQDTTAVPKSSAEILASRVKV